MELFKQIKGKFLIWPPQALTPLTWIKQPLNPQLEVPPKLTDAKNGYLNTEFILTFSDNLIIYIYIVNSHIDQEIFTKKLVMRCSCVWSMAALDLWDYLLMGGIW